MAEKRVWLVGEHNPHGADPRLALFPRPPNGAGGRLCRLLRMSEREYLRAFERRNLLSELPWRAAEARSAARRVLSEARDGSTLVLLGRRVAAAFGFRYEPFEAYRHVSNGVYLRRVAALVLPHPSGRCRLWNEPDAAARARKVIAGLLGQESGLDAEPLANLLESTGAEP